MRMSQLFTRTLRQAPAEAESEGHRLALRAGLIRQTAAGIYSYLPLGWRSYRKIEQIIREEMDAIGAQELSMPVLQPRERWEETGRWESFQPPLFKLRDRRGHSLCLGPTHEEVVTDLVRHHVRSYRDLPLLLYQIQTKFRDELRPRGGLLRAREFGMKDLYSFDATEDGLDVSYHQVVKAYERIFDRCGLPWLAVEADSGPIGGKESLEFMLLGPAGDDEVVRCGQCGYAANREKARARKVHIAQGAPASLYEVSTPGVKTIAALAAFLGTPEHKALKAVFYAADGRLIFAVIRGDLTINEVKLRNLLQCQELRLASDEEVKLAGLVAGSASPVGLTGIPIIADDSVADGNNFVAGGNRSDIHLVNVNYPRDFTAETLADIALARDGDGCPRCPGSLQIAKGLEVGHVFKLGTLYSEPMRATFLDRNGHEQPVLMGCYGIGIGRLLAAAVEQNHDERGIIWPPAIAPYTIHLCALGVDNGNVHQAAEKLYTALRDSGHEVLFDDRLESPGVKFNDADLLGLPLRVVISPRTLSNDCVEVKRRRDKSSTSTSYGSLVQRLPEWLRS
ncbi:MAG: proline--tRNA ligase [Chloroflexi bacterium]|nr:proline--tRNA ligase [Chloroflexota bacterium]